MSRKRKKQRTYLQQIAQERATDLRHTAGCITQLRNIAKRNLPPDLYKVFEISFDTDSKIISRRITERWELRRRNYNLTGEED